MYNLLRTLISFTLLSFSTAFQAHGGPSGGGGQENSCRVYIEEYGLMVSVYQPSVSEQDTYCSTLPAFAESIVVFDIIDRPLRQVPLSIQIAELPNEPDNVDKDEHQHIGKTITAVPFDLHKSGTMRLTFTPEEDLQYAAILTTLDKEGHSQSIDFPFIVGENPDGFTDVKKKLITYLLTLLIVCGYFAFRPKKQPKTEENYPAG